MIDGSLIQLSHLNYHWNSRIDLDEDSAGTAMDKRLPLSGKNIQENWGINPLPRWPPVRSWESLPGRWLILATVLLLCCCSAVANILLLFYDFDCFFVFFKHSFVTFQFSPSPTFFWDCCPLPASCVSSPTSVQVSECNWPSRQAPSLHNLFAVCKNMHNWLRQNPKNVCVITCSVRRCSRTVPSSHSSPSSFSLHWVARLLLIYILLRYQKKKNHL